MAFETTHVKRRKIMARENEKTESSESNKGPDYIAYHVREGERGKRYWTRLGAAFAHKDGEGINIQLDVLPVGGFDGRLVLRAPKDEPAKQDGK
jgi:hypothetical protein